MQPTMRGMNRLFRLGKSLDDLSALGIQIGTDIPFVFIIRLCALGEVRR